MTAFKAVGKANIGVPPLSHGKHPDRVILTLPMMSLIPEPVLSELQDRFGKPFLQLSKPEIQALITAHLEGEVSNTRLQQLIVNHRADITQILLGLCQKGMLVSDNRRRWARYRLGSHKENSPHSKGEVPSLAAEVPSLGAEVPSLAAEVPSLEGNFDQSNLVEIALPVSSKQRVTRRVMNRVILELCADKFLNAEQLASLLNRKVTNLQERYIAPLVIKGELLMKYPEAPNHPNQAYISLTR